MQDGVFVSGNSIKGNLKFIEGGIAQSGPLAGDGHFLAIKFDSDNWNGFTSVMVGLDPSVEKTGLVELINDPDKNGVFKITSTSQKFMVVASNSTSKKTYTYDLSNLTLENE